MYMIPKEKQHLLTQSLSRRCNNCRDGLYDMCLNYNYIGDDRNGAFAEFVNVPVDNLIELPETVDYEQGALLSSMALATNAMRTGCFGMNTILPLDRPIAISGACDIGFMIVMLLKDAGFRNIFLIGNNDNQKKRAKNLGISEKHFCNSDREDVVSWLNSVTDGGVYTFFECDGRQESIRYGIESGVPGGWIILVGNHLSDVVISKYTYHVLLKNQLTITGVSHSSFRQALPLYMEEGADDWNYVLQRIADGKLHPEQLISHRFSFEELDQGIIMLRNSKDDCCKIIVEKK